MTVATTLRRVDEYSESERQHLAELRTAVYPPDEAAKWPGSAREWARPEWGVLVTDSKLGLTSYTGIVIREASHDGVGVHIGGIGGVATHPDSRRRGFAAAGIGRAVDFLLEQGVLFALLVCDQALIPYYRSLGWRVFAGTVLDEQRGVTEVFTFNEVMVLDMNGPAPESGTIDLRGPPW